MVMRQNVSDEIVAAAIVTTAETVIAQITNVSPTPGGMPIALQASCSILLAADTTSLRLRIRRGGVAGTVVADSQAVARAASTQVDGTVAGDDYLQDVAAQAYVLTAVCGAATANATVNAVCLQATYQ